MAVPFIETAPSISSGWSATNVNVDEADLSGVHVHEFLVETVEGTCEEGVTYRFSCACGEHYEYTRTADHEWGAWETETFPTLEKEGVMVRHCTKCGKTDTHSIAKLTDADGDGYDDETYALAGPISLFYSEDYSNVPVKEEMTAQTESSGFPTWAIVAIAVSASLIAALLTVLILTRKKGKKAPAPKDPDPADRSDP